MTDLSPAQRERVSRVEAALATSTPSDAASCEGHLRVALDGAVHEALLGESARPGRVPRLEWRAAALAAPFLAGEENRQFRTPAGGRTLQGTLLERNLLRFEGGRIVEIATPRTVFFRRDGRWRAGARRAPPGLEPRPRALRSREAADPIVLDPAQRKVVERRSSRALLVLGEAGYGKTTVLLHRVARLRRAAGRGFRAAVLVPTDGLATLARSVLVRLGAPDVAVWRFDRWALAAARAAFPDLPARDGADATAATLRLKRHAAIRDALRVLAARPPAQAEDAPPSHRAVTREDLLHLFGDRDLLRRVIDAARGAIPAHALPETVAHARVQFSETAEEEFAHVDPARLRPLDGCALDLGTPTGDAGTVDAEDAPVLFELDRLRAQALRRRPAAPPAYDCLALDEAQELAPLELALAGRSLAPGGTLLVAGDEAQQLDPAASFDGWDASMRELGAERWDVERLETSHRCPPGVTELARAVRRGRRAPAGRGSDVLRVAQPGPLHLLAWLVEALRRLRASDRAARVAIVCRRPATVRTLAPLLQTVAGVREWDGSRALRPGAHLAWVQDVRGLEFDHVIVPDADADTYPDAPDARRALYVALTRARHQAVLATASAWSPLLAVPQPAGAGAGVR